MALLILATRGLQLTSPEVTDIVELREQVRFGAYPLEEDGLIVRREMPQAEANSQAIEGIHLVVSGRLMLKGQKPEEAAGAIARQCYLELDAKRERRLGGETSIDTPPLVRVEVTLRGTDATSKPIVVRLTREEYRKANTNPAPTPHPKAPGDPPPKNPPSKKKP